MRMNFSGILTIRRISTPSHLCSLPRPMVVLHCRILETSPNITIPVVPHIFMPRFSFPRIAVDTCKFDRLLRVFPYEVILVRKNR